MKALIVILVACAVFGGAGYFTYDLFIRPEQALKAEKLAPATPRPPDPSLPEFNKCVALRKSGKILQARDAFYTFIEQNPFSTKLDEAKDLLGDINTDIYLTPLPAPEKQVYIVKRGDVIDRVARRLKTTGELIMRANQLSGTMLRIDQKLTIPPTEFSIVISRKKDKVIVSNKGRFFKQYPVLQWPAAIQKQMEAKTTLPKQAGKVTDKMAWHGGSRIIFADKDYAAATHWIQISIAHCTLHSEIDEKSDSRPIGGGIVLPPKALDELAVLLSKGDPVTLE